MEQTKKQTKGQNKKSTAKKEKVLTKYEKIRNFINHTPVPTKSSTFYYYFTILFILLIGFAVIVETIQRQYENFYLLFIIGNIAGTVFFLFEYIIRFVFTAKDVDKFTFKASLRYVYSFMGIIDLLTWVSLFISFFNLGSLNKLVYILRLVVFFKIIRYSNSIDIIIGVLKRKKEEILMTMILSLLLLFFASVMMYYAEHDIQPDKFPDLISTLYWAGITLGTIGYGDIYPITALGRIIAGGVAFLGLLLFMLPASVIGSGFADEMESRNPHYDFCPKCNKRIGENEFITDIDTLKRRKKLAANLEQSEPDEKINSYQSKQKKYYNLIENKYPTELGPRLIRISLFLLILLSSIVSMIGTNITAYNEFKSELDMISLITTLCFTLEYIFRVWLCTASDDPRFKHALYGRLRYMITPVALIDLIVILPFYLNLFQILPIDDQILRVFGLLTMLKVNHCTSAVSIIVGALKERKKEFFIAIYISLQIWLFQSAFIYLFESGAQPDKFSSITLSMWWGIETLTTLGYGDIFPITAAGKTLAVISAFLGVATFSIPVGIIGSSFFSNIEKQRMHKICPKCGHILSKPKIIQKTPS